MLAYSFCNHHQLEHQEEEYDAGRFLRENWRVA
jgi:hypothetical protein